MPGGPAGVRTGAHFVDGDHACCEGALAGGCRFVAGYPITPSTEVVERIALRFPEVGGVFIQLVPFLFQAQWGVNPNFLLIIFGAGLLQVLLTAPGGLVDQVPKDLAKLRRLVVHGFRKLAGARGQAR